MAELHRLSLREAARLLRARKVTPAELDGELRSAIARHDPALRAYVRLSDPADEPPAGGPPPKAGQQPLWGLGGALKANICARGLPTDCASRILAGWQPPYDATAVTRLRAAGAHWLGLTNMDEFGMGSSCEHSAYGPTRNPWDPARTPGGSSGGAAAAVAADLAFFALGSDTGGSIRQPAHCCGVVGLKPTYGRVSRYGLVAFASSLDQIGPLAKDVADCALVYSVLAGCDPRDATSLDASPGDPLAAVERPAAGLRVGVPRDALAEGVHPDVVADFESTLEELQEAGARIVEVTLPSLSRAIAAYYVVATAEAAANLARYDGVRYGPRAAGRDYRETVTATRTAGFGLEVKRRILLGTYVLSAGYRDAYYLQAERVRGLVAEDFARAFSACDAVALPTAPAAAFPLGERLADPLQMYLSDVFTVPASLAGLPALTLPTGLDRDGLPLSLQLVGPALAEETLFTLAGAVERARNFRARKEAAWRTRR